MEAINFCTQCGARLRPKAKFFSACGVAQLAHQATSTPSVPASQQGRDIQFQGPTTVNGDVISAFEVNKYVYVIPSTPTYLDAALDTLQAWNECLFQWSAASEEARSSWDGMVRHAMTAMAARVSLRGLLSLLLMTALGTVTVWWVAPILQWPLTNLPMRLLACLQYAIGSVLIPLAVAIVTQPMRADEFPRQTFQQQRLFITVKFTEAVIGFQSFSGLMLFIALLGYHIGGATFALPVRRGMALLSLFFTYIAARRFPMSRYQPVNGKVKLHEVDRFFLLACTPFGLVVAGVVYWGHDLITHWTMGLAITIGFIGFLTWDLRQRTPMEFSDPLMILLLGGILPASIFALAFFFARPRSSLPPNLEGFYVAVAAAYFLSSTLFLTTLFVRRKPVLTLPGVFGGFCLLWTLVFVTNFNVQWGRGLSLLVAVLWAGWGRRYFRHYLWFHPSFWVMGGGLLGSVAVGLLTPFPLWANALSFVFLSGFLIVWAYHRPQPVTEKINSHKICS